LGQFVMPRSLLPWQTPRTTPERVPPFPVTPAKTKPTREPSLAEPRTAHRVGAGQASLYCFSRPSDRLPDSGDVGKRHITEDALHRLVDGLPHRAQAAPGGVDAVGII